MVADEAQASEPTATIAPKAASPKTNFRIEALSGLRNKDDSGPGARQKG
jgi:hypothetical protein